mgnify:CR=1 FL=1
MTAGAMTPHAEATRGRPKPLSLILFPRFARAAAADFAFGDETEGAVETAIFAMVRVRTDTGGDALELLGELAVGLIAFEAETAQLRFGGGDAVADLLHLVALDGEFIESDAGEDFVRGEILPATRKMPAAVEDVAVA